jgi:hypothetical protein
MDLEGQLSIWDLKQNLTSLLSFRKIRATCISVNPFEDDVLAVGSQTGEIYVLDTSGKCLVKGWSMFKVRG